MAAEIIAQSPQLGHGLGVYLKHGADLKDMPEVIAAIFVILLIGIGIELLVFRPIERRVLHVRGLAGIPNRTRPALRDRSATNNRQPGVRSWR